ncbi:MAG TPA: phospho-sugar mutase [Actinotalea caeni]|uniref:phospho-sugar mutase n=1 Tax=Actinotalea caeni TaxID=1348467 RepID=UPI002B4ACDC0|nr:phospho-sugar mutase [Actinotalea caeni]HLV57081.1 phospho-sugar mutase [Actinotalea caeni]
MSADADLLARAHAWADDDPDDATAAELRALAERATAGDADALADLADRFAGTLQFGTAGLRGALGAGPMRMNRAVVIRAAAGLSSFLRERLGGPPVVVIGYDARHGSHRFAQDTADVVAAAGGRALLLPQAWPTPVLAFAVRHLGADAGVMVTASHNPPQDNGYKVYLGGRVVTDAGQGAQIVPPYDSEIAAAIAAVGRVADVPRSAAHAERTGGTQEVLGTDVLDAYVTRAMRLAPAGGARDVRVVLTPLHGVGGALVERVLREAGFTDVTVVAEQAAPDPDFPTVAFPNPEEPGALDLALATARRVDADLVVANDPDADRCSVAVPDPRAEGGWRQLSGDEVGALLGELIGSSAAGTGATLACSVVSSRLLAAIAARHGLEFRATLTGFKWIARVPGLDFGYEEALGYCVDPAAVRDKDGITAALLIVTHAARLRSIGRSLLDALDDIARAYGVYATGQLSVRVADLSLIGAAMSRLRQAPPTALGGSAVVRTLDLSEGTEELPPTDGLLYETADRSRVIVRPSGTEPKLKCYLEVIADVEHDADDARLAEVRAQAAERLAAVRADVAAAAGV